MKLHFIVLGTAGLLALRGVAAEGDYYQTFTNAVAHGQKGFMSGSSLVLTNNPGPVLTNSPVSFSRLQESGELAGIKLGMSMSEVVAIWGKPSSLASSCFIGPRFWYGRGLMGDLSLSFKRDRLVIIAISRSTASNINFDNGLNGKMGRADCERLLGPPTLSHPDPFGTLYVGDIAYRRNGLRTDLSFLTSGVMFFSVRLEREAEREVRGEQAGPGKESQPIR